MFLSGQHRHPRFRWSEELKLLLNSFALISRVTLSCCSSPSLSHTRARGRPFIPLCIPLLPILQVFFRASLAILKLSEERLLELDLESIMLYLSRFPHEGVLEKKSLAPAALALKVRKSHERKK